MMRRVAPALALSGVALAGCAHQTGSDTPPNRQPAQVVPIPSGPPGSNLHKVTLTAEAVTRLALQTTPIASAGKKKSVPFSAVIYDPQGQSWAYAVIGDRAYQREPVTIDSIKGALALLSSGPPVGVPVVTAGAPELLGVEYGVGEE